MQASFPNESPSPAANLPAAGALTRALQSSAAQFALEQALARPPLALPGGLLLRKLGLQAYTPTWDAMRAFTAARQPDTPDEIWLVEHLPVYTLGQAAKPEHVLAPGDIPVVRTDRGGQVTYHGPGQAVAYVLLDIRRRHWLVRETVYYLEEAVIRSLARQGVVGVRRPSAPGIYLGAPHALAGAKISSLGLKVRGGCTYHGVSINVDMDLAAFRGINPCGYPGLDIVDLARLCVHTLVDTVGMCFATELAMLADAQAPRPAAD
jgi:lipoyl(octanoyl) transferase